MLDGFQRYWHADQEEPRFLIDLAEPEAKSRYRIRAIGAMVYHIVLIVFALNAPSNAVHYSNAPQVHVDIRRATPLVAKRKACTPLSPTITASSNRSLLRSPMRQRE